MERGKHAHRQEPESLGFPADDPDDFGPLTRRQAENLSDFADRRRESKQFEAIGRAVYTKVLYLVGAAGIAFWYFLGDTFKVVVAQMLK